MSKVVYLRVLTGKSITLIGSWGLPSELIDNFEHQKDLGWHVFHALANKADKVEIVYGDMNEDHEKNVKESKWPDQKLNGST